MSLIEIYRPRVLGLFMTKEIAASSLFIRLTSDPSGMIVPPSPDEISAPNPSCRDRGLQQPGFGCSGRHRRRYGFQSAQLRDLHATANCAFVHISDTYGMGDILNSANASCNMDLSIRLAGCTRHNDATGYSPHDRWTVQRDPPRSGPQHKLLLPSTSEKRTWADGI